MSLRPHDMPTVPEETVRVARAACPRGTLAMRLRDHLATLYEDAAFAPLFPACGQPAEVPWRLALVTVLQFADGLSDRQAAEAVRVRVDWKYALALELTDPGFDYSVLCEFRARLLDGGAEHQLLDALLTRCTEQGLLKRRGRQRTDSTHVLAAIRLLNRLACVGETLRHTLNSLATVAPEWLRAQVTPEWFERYSVRFEEYRLPQGKDAREALATMIGHDGTHLLTALFSPQAPLPLRDVAAVDTLRRVWLQQYYAPDADGVVRWRDRDNQPPSALLIHSPYDVEARYSTKRSTAWVGYKVHVTETCDEDTPHLITNVETTLATTDDSQVTATIHTTLARKDLLPAEHLLDTGYMEAELIVTSRAEHDVTVCGPVPPDTSWQARAKQGFDTSCFAIDWEAQTVTCPQGTTSVQWKPTKDASGNPAIHVAFKRAVCAACPQRAQCTHSATTGRELTLRTREQFTVLQAARQEQTTAAFHTRYAARAGIEGTLSQGVRLCDLRHARYTGLAKTRLQHVAAAVAINLHRLEDWWTATPRVHTRCSVFAALAAA